MFNLLIKNDLINEQLNFTEHLFLLHRSVVEDKLFQVEQNTLLGSAKVISRI